MSRDVMVHIKETLDGDAQRSLLAYLDERMGVGVTTLDSSKPHLLFLPADPQNAPPHAVLDAVRERGYHATLVDL